MKKLIKKGFLTICLAGCVSSTMAATTLNLKVQGKIIPPSCTPTFASGGGILDFGTIKLSSLSLTQDTYLQGKSVPVVINCQEAARFGLTFTDQRRDSAKSISVTSPSSHSKAEFGLGYGPKQSKIGAYAMAVNIDSIKNKDNAGRWLITNTGGSTWSVEQTKWGKISGLPTTVYSFSNTNVGTDPQAPTAEQQIRFDLLVEPAISDLTNLKVTDEIDLDGLALISLVYL